MEDVVPAGELHVFIDVVDAQLEGVVVVSLSLSRVYKTLDSVIYSGGLV